MFGHLPQSDGCRLSIFPESSDMIVLLLRKCNRNTSNHDLPIIIGVCGSNNITKSSQPIVGRKVLRMSIP